MKRTFTILASLSALALFASTASAQTGNFRLSWENCDPIIVNQDFTGPGQVARLVGSVLGTGNQHKGFRFKVLVQSGLPDAWRFDAAGCNTGQVGLSTALLNKACPAFQGANPLPIFNYGFETDQAGTATLDVLNAYDTAVPSPGTRYTVFQAIFDHLFSEAGPQDPLVACGNADQPLCLALIYTEFLNPDLSSDVFNVENDYVTWQDLGNSTGCPGPTQNEATTWGRVKGLYR